MPTSQPEESGSMLWTGLKYSILVYFYLLILPFTLVLLASRLYSLAQNCLTITPSGLESDLPALVRAPSPSCTTPRSSGEWGASEWEERIPLMRKKREWAVPPSQPRFWEDDDGYDLRSRRASSMGSIREE